MSTTSNASTKLGQDSLLRYTIGFLVSIVLTLAAYILVVRHSLSVTTITGCIVVLAVAQFLVQLVFFLHLGRESRPRWNLLAFSFMLIVLSILVFGTLWIMHNLDYHMMPPMETEEFIVQDEGMHTGH